MPIKKIILSGDLLKKLEESNNPVFVVGIPAGTAPESTGDFVLQEVKQQSPGFILASTTGTTISFVAVEGEKEHMKLKKVKLHLGVSPTLDFEWEQEFRGYNT